METLNNHSDQTPSREEIAFYAYLAWEKDGRQPGQDQKYWLQAEAQLRDSRTNRPAVKPAQPQTEKQPVAPSEPAGGERPKSKAKPGVKTTEAARKAATNRRAKQKV